MNALNRSLFFSATCLMLVCGACKNEEPSSEKSVTTPPPSLSQISLPGPLGAGDPRQSWIEDLVRPRLSRYSQIKWTCLNGGRRIELALDEISVDCPLFLQANFPAPHKRSSKSPLAAQPTCTAEGKLRIPLQHETCQPGRTPQFFQDLRLPVGSGLYLPALKKNLLTPVSAGLPPLILNPETSPETLPLRTPTLSQWLKSAHFQGSVWLTLQLPSSGTTNSKEVTRVAILALLKERLAQWKEPQLFHPSLEGGLTSTPSAPPPTALSRLSPPALPALRIRHRYAAGSLFAEGCQYLQRWMETRQMLAPEAEVDPHKTLTLECEWLWEPDRPKRGPLLTIAHLPLPLLDLAGQFPFRTLEDALSPSLLQSLLQMNKESMR